MSGEPHFMRLTSEFSTAAFSSERERVWKWHYPPPTASVCHNLPYVTTRTSISHNSLSWMLKILHFPYLQNMTLPFLQFHYVQPKGMFIRLCLYIIKQIIYTLCKMKHCLSSIKTTYKVTFGFCKFFSISWCWFVFTEILFLKSYLFARWYSCNLRYMKCCSFRSYKWRIQDFIYLYSFFKDLFPNSIACSWPKSVSGESVAPHILFSTFQTVWPCRVKYTVPIVFSFLLVLVGRRTPG